MSLASFPEYYDMTTVSNTMGYYSLLNTSPLYVWTSASRGSQGYTWPNKSPVNPAMFCGVLSAARLVVKIVDSDSTVCLSDSVAAYPLCSIS